MRSVSSGTASWYGSRCKLCCSLLKLVILRYRASYYVSSSARYCGFSAATTRTMTTSRTAPPTYQTRIRETGAISMEWVTAAGRTTQHSYRNRCGHFSAAPRRTAVKERSAMRSAKGRSNLLGGFRDLEARRTCLSPEIGFLFVVERTLWSLYRFNVWPKKPYPNRNPRHLSWRALPSGTVLRSFLQRCFPLR